MSDATGLPRLMFYKAACENEEPDQVYLSQIDDAAREGLQVDVRESVQHV